MMKNFTLLLIFCLSGFIISAQNCEPMEGLPIDQVALFPLPAGVIPPANGGIGIDKVATIGEEFSYTWTLSVPRNYVVGGIPTTADSTLILVDSVYYEKDGVKTFGLPEGLSLVFEPDNGVIIPTDENTPAVACFAITGTPSANVIPGDYNIFFSISNCVSVTGFSGCIESTIPSAEAMIPGLYTLTIEEAPTVNCEPFEGLPTDQVALLPLPAGVIPPAQGGIGIDKTATIGEEFSYTWTLSVPRNYVVGGIPTTADSTLILVDSVYYEKDGVKTFGLPEGLSLVFEPDNGVIIPTDENTPAVACFAITGTPSANVIPGDYNIFFGISNCVSVTGFSGCIESTIPSAEAMVPGLYTLTIEEASTVNCEPFEGLPTDQVALFPLPAGVIPPAQGGIGIDKTATIGEEFSYTWTLSVPRNYVVGGIPTTADSTLILVDSVYYEKDGVKTFGLPEGLSLVFEPNNGVIIPTDENTPAVACFAITGTPSANVIPGDYNIFFGISNCVSVTGFSGCIESTIPSAEAMVPGLYTLTIEGDPNKTTNVVKEGLQVGITPNPFTNSTAVNIHSNLSGSFNFQVFDGTGRAVHQRQVKLNQGENSFIFHSNNLPRGIYIYTLQNELGVISGKMVVQK